MNQYEKGMNHLVELVMDTMQEIGEAPYLVPVGISARHVHLTKEHVEALFGKGYQLTFYKKLSQPGQFAAAEIVEVAGPKGSLHKVRILGPVRKESQVEVAASDGRALGIAPPVRASGELEGTPGVKIKGPAGEITLERGLIVAERHVHMTPKDATWFGVRDGEKVSVRVLGQKAGILQQVTVRVSESYRLDLHLDTDDANAFLLKQGQKVALGKGES